jgi:hypothetical protein
MPNDDLLLDLETTREAYAQKQKAANALLTGIKNFSGTLNKTSRALEDYAVQNISIGAEMLDEATDGFNTVRSFKETSLDRLLADLRREANRLTLLVGALRDASGALRSNPVDVVKLDQAYGVMGRNASQEDQLDDLLSTLADELHTAQEQLGSIFGSALRNGMSEIGVDVTGQPPRFQIGRFELGANFVTRKASLNYGKLEVVKNIPLSLEGIIRTYQRELKNIEGRAEDGPSWMKQFYEAWERARQSSGKAGTRINVVDVYYELVLLRQNRAFMVDPSKRSFRDYSRAQFIHDFVEFAYNQRLGVDGKYAAAHVATRSQADSPSKSMWIVTGRGPHDGDYIADIEFKQD